MIKHLQHIVSLNRTKSSSILKVLEVSLLCILELTLLYSVLGHFIAAHYFIHLLPRLILTLTEKRAPYTKTEIL